MPLRLLSASSLSRRLAQSLPLIAAAATSLWFAPALAEGPSVASSVAGGTPQLELTPLDSAPGGVTPPAATPATIQREPIQARAVIVDIDSDTLVYDKEKDQYVATGKAHVVISEQNSDLTADKVIYDEKTGIMIAEGHVVIVKHGQKTEGTYAKIDLTRESALITDLITTVSNVRVKAKTAYVDPDYVELHNGRFLIKRQTLLQSSGGAVRSFNQQAFGGNAYMNFSFDDGTQIRYGSQQPQIVTLDQAPEGQEKLSSFRIKAEEIRVHRGEDGYDDIDLKWPSLYLGKVKVGIAPQMDFSNDGRNQHMEYLGPDFGYDQNMGGAFAGPGWDFRLGKGNVRVSPLLTFGTALRRNDSGTSLESLDAAPGLGAALHYRTASTRFDALYSLRSQMPILRGEQWLFGSRRTRLRMAMNNFSSNGFFGSERPGFIAQITDQRTLGEIGNFRIQSYESFGWARDEFFPTNRSNFFVKPEESSIPAAGRLELQTQILNVKPLWRIGGRDTFMTLGALAQASLSGYSTGDLRGIVRAGPHVQVKIANRLFSTVQYFTAATLGETPFVFDSYFSGAQNVVLNNAFRISDYLILGTQNNLNLNRDNSRKALAVGNIFYMLVGPRDVKLNLAYDFISKRTFFGINFYPGAGDTPVDFQRMKMYQPQNYTPPPPVMTP